MELKTLEQVREFFKEDKFATDNYAVIDEIGDGYSVCSMEIHPVHKNAMGAVMGGAYFTLADFAFAVAANVQSFGTVSIRSDIAFLGAAKGSRLIARAECVKNGRSSCYYTVTITDDVGTQVAAVNITGFHKQ